MYLVCPYPDVPAFEVGTAGVKKLLWGLKPHKASGPDNIPTSFLKEAANELAPALYLIRTASLNKGYVPDDWKTADGTPIFKKGDRSTSANYRPISLTAVCCKMMEHILHSQVMKHLDLHKILSDNQHGFHKKQSRESQLILTIQDLASGLEDGKQINAILLDFSKAFDKVPHQRLLLKLQHYGIRDYWIKQRFSSIASLFKWELLFKERICSQSLSFPLWAVPYSRENQFYHIKWPPLNVTIFITHVRILRNGCYANGYQTLILCSFIAASVLHWREARGARRWGYVQLAEVTRQLHSNIKVG